MTKLNPSQASVFSFHGKNVRTYTLNGEPWFVAKDVCEALDIAWGRKATLESTPLRWQTRLPFDREGGLARQAPDEGIQATQSGLTLVSEPAVYQLAFRSHKPEAVAFTEWGAEVVLPTIRKTGSFCLEQEVEGQASGELARAQRRMRLRTELASLERACPDGWLTIGEFLRARSQEGMSGIDRLRLAGIARKAGGAPVRAFDLRARRVVTYWPESALETGMGNLKSTPPEAA